MSDTPIVFSEHEQALVSAFLGTSPDDTWNDAAAESAAESAAEISASEELDEYFTDVERDLDMPIAADALLSNVNEENREELLQHITICLDYCASYHKQRTGKMLSMLSTIHLRHLTNLLEEMVHPEISEQRWQEMRLKACTQAMKHRNNLAALSEEDLALSDEEDDEIILGGVRPVEQEEDFRLTPMSDGEEDLYMTADADITGILGTVIAQTASSDPQVDLFAEPPTDKEQWSQIPIDLDAT